MKTGEGKTLVSTLAGYLNALTGKSVHIVTVNDYLARRDSQWMGAIYRFLGMEVGLVQNGMRPSERIPAYKADVTYGTNAEFGFDYLRDNMVTRADQRVQRGHYFAIVDEVDSILIDEARTPLIISGAGVKAADMYKKFAQAMFGLVRDEDFEMDEAKRTIMATESGLAKIESRLGIEDIYADPSSTSSRVASWRAVVTPRVFIRHSRQSTTCASARRTRRLRPLRCRTISDCTKNFPA